MQKRILRKILWISAAVSLLIICLAGGAFADTVDIYLDVQAFDKTMPDGAVVRMWGYGKCDSTGFTNCQAATVPGPLLTRPTGAALVAGDTLNIHVRNSLAGPYTEPVSVMIPGQVPVVTVNEPVWTDGTSGPRTALTQRVRSMTHETPLAGGTAVYTWNSLKAGTYLYQSGSHPNVQVQMGLYGPLKVDVDSSNQAYTGVNYATDVVLVFSEIDPSLHTAVAGGTYGTAQFPSMNPSSSKPEYFLINGNPYSASQPPVFAGLTANTVLLRFLNASFAERVPLLQGAYMSVIAEDGNLYPYPKELYAVVLPAGKTVDALVSIDSPAYLALYDRRLGLTNVTGSTGGMLTYLGFAGSASANALTVGKDGNGQGTVTSVPGGIACGTKCTATYTAGVTVSLVASPSQGSVFAGWSGACAGTGDCILPMTSSASVTATFSKVSAVKVLSPNGGEAIPTNSVYPIQWQAPASATSFKVHYSLDNGASWTVIDKNASGSSYSWKVPKTGNNVTTALVRVKGYASPGGTLVGSDTSNKPFTIEVVRLTSPNGGESLTSGNFHTITWKTNATLRSVKTVVLKYSLNDGKTWNPLATISGFDPGSYSWAVPAVPKTKTKCRVKVVLKDSQGALGKDLSDATFTINPTPLP